MIYQITIPGMPQGKARARTVKGHTYTPDKTVNYEALIKMTFMQKYKQLMMCKQISIDITACFGIPKSASKIKTQLMLEGTIRPTKKPDLDNIAKVVCDSLNEIAYHDDSQIVELIARKFYSDKPRVEIEIREVDEC